MATAHEYDLLHILMENTLDAIYFKDLRSHFLYINRGLAERFGLANPAEAVGKTDFDFFTEEHARQAYLDEQEVIRSGQPLLAREEKEVWSNGRISWASTTKLPLRDRNGVIIGTFGISRDITDRKQTETALREAKELAEISQQRSRLIVDSAYDAYVAMDGGGLIIDWNRQAEAVFGWSREEVMGQPLHEFIIPPNYREAHVRGVEQFLATGEGPLLNRRIEMPALRRDGREFPVEMTIAPIRYGSEWLFSAFLHDITERKRAERELREARDAAEAASQAKSEFLANMSHEIRTPMNAIIGMTELLLDTPLSVEQRDYLETVKKSADALLSVINDILDFSKIEAGKLELDHAPFDLRDSLGDMLNTLALRAHQKGLELACHIAPEAPEIVVGDPARLRQVLINLVGNAIKFTEHGEVVVDVTMQKTEGGRQKEKQDDSALLHFEVRDTGIGVPADKRGLIFGAFVQADGSTTRRYGGTGLGLAISSRLVQRMGGSIWVESAPNQGSAFHFTARFGLRDAARERLSPSQPSRLRGLTTLVVDDNATNRFILAETLVQWQMRPTVVENAADALRALEQAQQCGEPFTLVLLDAHMPEVDGFTLAERIREHPDLVGATVMMLSSACQPIDTARCQELGLAAYLTKPIKQADLHRAILAALGSSTAAPLAAPPAAPPPARPGRTLRLLLAEDNVVNQKLAARLLEKQGHTVVIADNGIEAVQAVQQQPFDLVLMDVQMPEMDGFEATAAIRAREQDSGRRLPIVAMTAYAMKGDRERCLAAGMDGYVSKPIQSRELCQAIDQLVPSGGADGASAAGDILDHHEALERVGGDTGLLRELIAVFRDDGPRLKEDIADALARGDAPKLNRAAHTLRGAVGTFGAASAEAAARELEALAGKGDLAAAAAAAAQLDTELAKLKNALLELERSL